MGGREHTKLNYLGEYGSLNRVMRGTRRGNLTIGLAILASVIVALGLVLMYVSISWMQAYGVDVAEEFDKHLQLMRMALIIEAVNYSDTKAIIYLRNISKYNVSISICKVELISLDKSMVVNSTPVEGFKELARLEISGDLLNMDAPTCPSCNPREALAYRVWYISSEVLGRSRGELDPSITRIAEFAFLKPS